jgi:hypothetical protein
MLSNVVGDIIEVFVCEGEKFQASGAPIAVSPEACLSVPPGQNPRRLLKKWGESVTDSPHAGPELSGGVRWGEGFWWDSASPKQE